LHRKVGDEARKALTLTKKPGGGGNTWTLPYKKLHDKRKSVSRKKGKKTRAHLRKRIQRAGGPYGPLRGLFRRWGKKGDQPGWKGNDLFTSGTMQQKRRNRINHQEKREGKGPAFQRKPLGNERKIYNDLGENNKTYSRRGRTLPSQSGGRALSRRNS